MVRRVRERDRTGRRGGAGDQRALMDLVDYTRFEVSSVAGTSV